MLYLKDFDTHASYEASFNDDTDIIMPSVSYCDDANDVHYMRYNLVRFYVGDMAASSASATINTSNNRIDVSIDKSKKWYTYVLPKGSELNSINSYYDDAITKIIVKCNISSNSTRLIPSSTVEASFKDSKLAGYASYMFSNCSGLTSLDLSSFNTSNVTSMKSMFEHCSGLTSLDLSSFDTSKVTNMSRMFSKCSKLTSLTLSSFDTSKVNSMEYMFNYCGNLTSLDLSKFNTSNVHDMNHMFTFCSKLTSLILSGWHTSNVYNMISIFNSCSSLKTLDISNWDISNVSSTENMFVGCTSLDTIRMKGCSEATINKIRAQLEADGISLDKVNIITK